MARINGSFTVEIAKTCDLTPPRLECAWDAEFDGDPEFEKVLLAYYRKHFEKALKALVLEKARALAVPLGSMQRHIDAVRKARAHVDRQTDADRALAALDQLKRLAPEGIRKQIKDYQHYLEGAVDNIRRQQLAVFSKHFEAEVMGHARKSIRREIRNKRVRHGINLTVVGFVLLGTTAAILAAAITSFGTAIPALAGLGMAGASIAGVTSLLTIAKSIKDIHDLERRSMRLLVKNTTDMAAELAATSTRIDDVGKHVNDVSIWLSRRLEITAQLQARLRLMERNLEEVGEDARRLRTTVPQVYRAQMARLEESQSNLVKVRLACEESTARSDELKLALRSASLLVAALGKIPYAGAKGIADNLTRLDFKDPVTYLGMLDALGGLARASAGVGKAATPHR